MLYKFKSKVGANLIMLEPNGRTILRIIGKDPEAAKGIVLPEQMPEAIAALEAAVAQESAELAQARGQQGEVEEPLRGGAPISLRQRAKPFIDMLRRCHQAGEDIVWGV